MAETRLIKRYESRKLYDTGESRYVSLEEIGRWIREGQVVQVLDNETSEDVTAWTLTQVLLEEGKKGTSFLPIPFLHEVIRKGGKAVTSGVEQLRSGMDRILRASLDRLEPVRNLRDESARLRDRLDRLEAALSELESGADADAAPVSEPGKRRARRPSRTKSRE